MNSFERHVRQERSDCFSNPVSQLQVFWSSLRVACSGHVHRNFPGPKKMQSHSHGDFSLLHKLIAKTINFESKKKKTRGVARQCSGGAKYIRLQKHEVGKKLSRFDKVWFSIVVLQDNLKPSSQIH